MTTPAAAFLTGYAIAAAGAGFAIGPWLTVVLGVALMLAGLAVVDLDRR